MLNHYLSGFGMQSAKSPHFKLLLAILFIGPAITFHASGQTNVDNSMPSLETIVCIRHGEKAPGGLGQLTCRGLNRALALPDVLLKKYGTPQFVFAPNPSQKVHDHGGEYCYVRPLATIEPTAIRCGLPVNTEFGFKEINGLEDELDKPQYENATVFIAWEHEKLDDFAKSILKDDGGNPALVPFWPNNEYDTIFIFKVTKNNGHKSIAFMVDHEGLNNLSDTCPQPSK
jgi:hypothetical protein